MRPYTILQELRQQLSHLANMKFRELGCVRRLLRSHVDRPRTTADVSNKAGGRLDHARRTYSHEDRAFVQCAENAIQLEGNFTEPAYMGTNQPTALTPRYLRWWLIQIGIVKWGSAARIAAAFEEFSMHMDDALRPSLLVHVIHVLGAQEQPFLQLLFETGE